MTTPRDDAPPAARPEGPLAGAAAVRLTGRTLAVLDYPAVVGRLAECTATPMGRELAVALRPLASRLAVAREQERTAEARALSQAGSPLSFEGASDVRAAVARAARGGQLEGADLHAVARTAAAAERLSRTLSRNGERCPRLRDIGEGLGDHRRLARAIDEAVLPDGELRDDASPELLSLRRQHRTWSGRLRDRLESLVRAPALQPFLQDAIVTNRAGRWVIPVKAEHRANVPGIVHDTSSSGATLFIEPMAVVEVTNELRRLEAAAREEERRILERLSRLVAGEAAELQRTVDAIGLLDLVAARARLADEMDAVAPEGLEGAEVDLRGARHPLLSGDVVPIDLRLGGDTRGLVVTGPNTGGKTVSLKTLGLLALMAQSGLAIPALPGSRLPVFGTVLCDAGDDQDVQQNLSTFSSHMTHIVEMLEILGILRGDGMATDPGGARETPRSGDAAGLPRLVLLDELGAGTDPDEGAALAMAILSRLVDAGCLVVATTHYSELKAFAHHERGLRNASVEFDAETLQPTYRLQIGLPGKSNAFAIAARLGLPGTLVDDARRRLTGESRDVADLLEELSDLRDDLRRERDAAEAARRAADQAAAEWRERRDALERERDEMARRARDEVEAWKERARSEFDELVAEARALAREARERLEAGAPDDGEDDPERLAERIADLREAWARRTRAIDEAPGGPRSRRAARSADSDLGYAGRSAAGVRDGEPDGESSAEAAEDGSAWCAPGRRVHVRSLRTTGEVEAPPDAEGQVAVRIGVMRAMVPLEDLEPADDGPGGEERRLSGAAGSSRRAAGTSRGPGVSERSADRPSRGASRSRVGIAVGARIGVSSELDLHGLTVDEALPLVDKYLDDAVLAGLREVRVVHGRGTGALRQAVRRFVADHPHVAAWRPARADEGGAGSTVCTLK